MHCHSLDANNDISFDSYIGIATTLHSNTIFHSLFISATMRVRSYENLWFSIELTQNSQAVI